MLLRLAHPKSRRIKKKKNPAKNFILTIVFAIVLVVGVGLAALITQPALQAQASDVVSTLVQRDFISGLASSQSQDDTSLNEDSRDSGSVNPEDGEKKGSNNNPQAKREGLISAESETTSLIQIDTSRLIVRFLDVGQGDSALITCGGKTLLIDGGPTSASSRLYSVLTTLGITHLDYVVATHPDHDHVGGLLGAFRAATYSKVYCSATTSDTDLFEKFVDTVKAADNEIIVPKAGDSFTLGDAKITFITPLKSFGDENNDSLVLRIDHGSNSFLFAADAEREAEAALVEEEANLEADVLKVAHHGSITSTTKPFVKAVDPTYAVISCGANNDFGHPTEEALTNLEEQDATIYRTDKQGNIVFVSDKLELKTFTLKNKVTF